MSTQLAWVTVDLKAIDHNIKQFRRLLKPKVKIMAVVKANAYGHGMFEVARQAIKSGADYLAVATAAEALELRKHGTLHHLVVLGAVDREDLKALIRNKIATVVYNDESFRAINKIADVMNQKAIVYVKIDTGLNRLGLGATNGEAIRIIKKIAHYPRRFQLEGLYSHLASVEELNRSYTNDQILAFERIVKKAQDLGLKIPVISIAGSAAATMMPESWFTCVRIGIEMYGLWPSRGVELWCKRSKKTHSFKLKPALSYRTRLIQVRKIPAGIYVGYGCSFQAPHAMTIGIVPVGYSEGLPRHLGNMGFALLKGAVVPMVGRICMNMTLLDTSRRPRAKVGDEVVLIGKSHTKEITATDMADWAGTINYEIITRIPAHIPRIYK
ncbi:MAG: alanine racemase [bacterium]